MILNSKLNDTDQKMLCAKAVHTCKTCTKQYGRYQQSENPIWNFLMGKNQGKFVCFLSLDALHTSQIRRELGGK